MRRLLRAEDDRQRRPAPVSKFKGPSIEVFLSQYGRGYHSEVVAEFGPLGGPRRRDRETRMTLRVNVVAATASGRRGRMITWLTG